MGRAHRTHQSIRTRLVPATSPQQKARQQETNLGSKNRSVASRKGKTELPYSTTVVLYSSSTTRSFFLLCTETTMMSRHKQQQQQQQHNGSGDEREGLMGAISLAAFNLRLW